MYKYLVGKGHSFNEGGQVYLENVIFESENHYEGSLKDGRLSIYSEEADQELPSGPSDVKDGDTHRFDEDTLRAMDLVDLNILAYEFDSDVKEFRTKRGALKYLLGLAK